MDKSGMRLWNCKVENRKEDGDGKREARCQRML